MIVIPSIHRGMVKRPNDSTGIYFQLRIAKAFPVAQNRMDPRPPIALQPIVYLLKYANPHREPKMLSLPCTSASAKREAIFCRVEEEHYADVVFERKTVLQ